MLMPQSQSIKLFINIAKHFPRSQRMLSNKTRRITPERGSSLRGSSLRHCARETQLFSQKCRCDSEQLATPFVLASRYLNLRPLASKLKRHRSTNWPVRNKSKLFTVPIVKQT